MDIDLHYELDPEQYAAVTAAEGPVLIIAGAGSGKTRVITCRIAYLLARGVPQKAILAPYLYEQSRQGNGRARSFTHWTCIQEPDGLYLPTRFRYIMIDEFQDTSLQQYEFIQQLESGHICVVGYDDQSIYSWRGADYRNIERFEADHPGFAQTKFERNYRSTGSIFTAANTVIAYNVRPKKKQLWSPQGAHGTPISFFEAEDDDAGTEKIIEKIRELRFSEHADWKNFGILVRTNVLAEAIEDSLVEHNIPYRVAGGPSFYQRREIKDIIAYLKAAANPDDDISVLRVLNAPRR